MSFKNIIFYCFVIFLNAGLYGQTFKTDAERLSYANELFEKGKFVEAERLFLESLSLNQTDPDLNFKYGTCLIYASEKKDESLRFLKYAVSKNADPRAHFYLGKALLLNYRFKEASDQFKIYKTKSSAADHVKLEVDLHTRMCENGRKLMNQLTELVVENKQRASLEKFYVSYDLSQIGGRIIVSEEFQSKHDKKLGYRSLIYFPPTNQDVIYYSSYGKDGATGLDLYAKKRLPNGEWGVEQLLPPQINTPYDEAYGFLHADQTTFYFCSKGHNSMGGFDVFKCAYDKETNSYGPAQNLDYKINTPDDDLMYVVDSLERNAYFASSRSSKYGYVDVYKVRVETYPMLNVILAGNFLNDVNPGDEATIKIEDPRNDEIIGMYSPNAQGKYVIILPKSGTYNFIVETKKSNKIHTSPVTIPPQMVMKPLKQKIMLVQNEGNEKLIIQNLFDEEVEDAEGIMADVMQQLANPNINIDQFDDSLLIDKDPEIYSNSKENEGNWTDADLKKMSEEMYLEAEKEALELKEKTDGAYAVASIKAKESQEYAKAAEDILKTIDGIENPLDKQKQAAQAKEYNEKAKEASMMATTALNLGNRLTVETENAQKEAAESKKTNDDIVAALNEKDPAKAQQQLEIVKDRLKEIISADAASSIDVVQVIAAQANEKKEEANREFEKAKEFRDEESKLNLRLNNLIAEQEKAKEKDKAGFDRQIEEIKEQIEQNKKWAEQAYSKAEKLDKEAEKLSKEAELMDDLLYEIENSTSPVLSQQEREILNQNIRNSSVEEKIGTNENSLSEFEPIDMSVLNNSTATTNTTNSNVNNNSTSDTSNNSNNTTNTTNDNGSNTNNTTNNTTNDNGSNTPNSTNNTTNSNGSNTTNNTSNTSTAISVPTIDFESNKTELARFETEKDPVVKAQKENEVYENWLNDINEKIQEIDALIPTATNQEDKDKLTSAKNTLENTKREVESKSAANLDVIANNANSNTNVTATTNATPTIPSTDFSTKKNELETVSSEKDPKIKAEKENVIYENWVNEINEKLQEIEAQIPLLTSEEDKKNWVEAKNTLNNSKTEIERNISANNTLIENATTVASTNTPDNASSTRTYIDNEPNNVKNTEGFKSLKNEVTNEKAVADDFENTVIPKDIYANEEAKNKVNEAESDRDKIIMIENEIAALNTNLENENKAKKKEAISKEIDAKENEKNLSEIQLGTKVFEADQIELKANDVALAALVENIKIEVANYDTDKNYIKANLLLQEAESQRRDAEVLYKKANSAETSEQKSTLLIEAHKLNQAALQNQNAATTLLEQVNSSNYVAEFVDPSLNKNTKTVNTTVFEDGNTTNTNSNTTSANTNTTSNNTNTTANNTTSDVNNTTSNNTNTNSNTTSTNTNTASNNTNTTANNTSSDVNNASSNNTNFNTNTNSNTNTSSTNTASSDTNNSNNNTTSSNTTNSTSTNNSTADNNTSTSTNTNTATNTNTNTTNTANNNSATTNNSGNNTTTSDNNSSNATNTSTTSITSNAVITNPTSDDINSGKVSIENATKMAEKNAQSTIEKQEVANVVFSPTETVKEAHTVTTEVPVVEMNRNTEFESETAQKIAQTDVKTVAKLDDLTTQIDAKRKELDAATSDKEKAKITKEVENLEKNRAKEELKVSDDYQKAASIELGNATAQVTTSKDVIKNNIENTYLENQATEYENSANQLIADATKLRSEAEKEKDKQEKAEMLKVAFSKEMEAANYLEKAADLKLQAELKENEISINELIDVSENLEERLSTKLNQQAEDVRREAAQMRQKAADLYTQSETAKGEDKFNLENQAETLNKSASRLENFATQLTNQSQQAAEKESEILAKNELLATLKTANIEEIRSNETYAKFNEVQKEIDTKTLEKSSLEGQKKGYENLAQQQEIKAKDIENKITSSTNEAEKVELNNQVNELNEFARANREKASELDNQIEKLDEEIAALQVNQNGVVFNLTEKEKNDFEALALSNENKEPIKKTASISFGDLISSTYKPEKVENTIVLFDEKIVYSDANPIPINPGFPDGLFYKVQVGAFNKPIPNDVFKGFAPITADKLPNSNLIRYRVGYFNGYTIANDAKNQIRQMGYSDAFVVAIYDGQPITLSQARSIERGEIPEGLVASNTTNTNTTANTTNTSTNTTTNTTNNSSNTASNTTTTNASNSNNTTNTNTASTTTSNTAANNSAGTNSTASNSTNNGNNNTSTTASNIIRTTEVDLGANAAKTNDADKIEGLFYTVQLGAYSKPIDATSVYNISPLVTKFVGQLYKYSTGIYRNIDDAVVRKNQVNALGMADAFVTVYYNGERITIERANQLIAEKGESIFATDSSGGLKQLQPNASTSVTNSSAVNTTSVPVVEVTSNGKFQIDLGTYSGEAPVDIANAMLIIQQYEIKTESKDASKRYYVGNFATPSDAQKVIDLYKENGVETIKIINLDEPVIEQPKGPAPVSGVSYRVFLGTYVDGNVPQTRANTFIELAELGIVKIQDTTGETYYCGNEGLFSSAQQLLTKFTEKGISIAEIKAFQNGVEIPLSDAKALTGE